GGLPTDGLLDGLPTDDLLGGLPTDGLLGGLPVLGGSGDGSDGTDGGSNTGIFTVDDAAMEVISAADTPEGVGEQIQMTIPVTNSSDSPISTLEAESDLGEVTCEAASLGAGESTTCSVVFTPEQGENTVTVAFGDQADDSKVGSFQFVVTYEPGNDSGDSNGSGDSGDSDGSNGSNGSNGSDGGSNTAAFTVNEPTLQVVAAGDTPEGVGEQIEMTIPVTNNGGSTVNLGAESDKGQVACAADTLGAGESTTCSVTFTPDEGENALKVTFVDEADNSKVTSYRFVCNYSSAGTAA